MRAPWLPGTLEGSRQLENKARGPVEIVKMAADSVTCGRKGSRKGGSIYEETATHLEPYP